MTTAAINLCETKIKSMIGSHYLVNGNVHKVQTYQFNDGKVMIGTDKKIFSVEIENANRLIENFLETDPEEKPADQLIHFEMKSLSGASEIKDIMMANIRRVQGDKEYIPQAIAVNESVKTLLDFAKTEIQMYDLMHKINSSKSNNR